MERVIGEIIKFTGGFAPSGTLPCDGRRINVTEYKSLFYIIGDKYSNEYNVPNTFCVPKIDAEHFIVYDGLFPVA